MRVLFTVIAALSVIFTVAGCGAKEDGEVSKAPPQSVSNAGTPVQVGGNASPNVPGKQ